MEIHYEFGVFVRYAIKQRVAAGVAPFHITDAPEHSPTSCVES